MKKRSLILLIGILVCGLLLAACSSNKGNCKEHIDADLNGVCDICSEEISIPEKTEFNVSFDLNGGGVMNEEKQIVAEKNARLVLPEPVRANYTFCGWFCEGEKWTGYDRVNSDMTLTAKWLSAKANSGRIYVKFDVNDGSGTILKTVSVKHGEYIKTVDLPQVPAREGYYFAGWHTRSVITEDDLVGGVSKYLYYAGESKGSAGMWNQEVASVFDPVSQIENLTPNGAAVLYARWVQVKEIADETQLNAMRKDLYGAYKLTADITLTKPWNPVGSYYANYELYNTEWWIHAFKGFFDGNGHTIRGLHFSDTQSNAEEGLHIAVQEGAYGVTITGLFGSVVEPAVVKNLTISACKVEEKIEGACYVGTVAGFMMGGEIAGVNALDSDIVVEATDGEFLSVTGLVGGFWSGTVRDCKASGQMNFTANRKTSETGELFVGGISGECYSHVEHCESNYKITVNVNDESTPASNGHLQVNVGGINGANCYLKDSKSETDISVIIKGSQGKVSARVGLAVGVERYGWIRGCELRGSINVQTIQCSDNVSVYHGSILGGFDFSTFAIIGPMFDPALKTRYIEDNTTTDAEEVVGEPNYKSDEQFDYVIRNNTVVG